MMNFESLVSRHGEFGLQAIIEGYERREGIRRGEPVALEARWQALMDRDQVRAQREAV